MSYSLSAKFANLKPSAVREILKVTNEPGMIAFAGGSPDTAAFPCEEVKKISAEILGEDPVSALVYGVSEGYEPLRETVRKWLKRRGNIGTDEDVVIITAGVRRSWILPHVCSRQRAIPLSAKNRLLLVP